MRAHIIGAGFSGLSSAWELSRRGFQVEIYDRSSSPGGLLGTQYTDLGLVESAANAVLNSTALEQVFSEIGMTLASQPRSALRRYIFRGHVRRWPLSLSSTLLSVLPFLWKFKLNRSRLRPLRGESIVDWGYRVLGAEVTDWALSVALQGVYAGDPKRLSASLILGRFFDLDHDNKCKPLKRGSVAPVGGMGEWMTKWHQSLEKKGAVFHQGTVTSEFIMDLVRKAEPIVIATSAWEASELLSQVDSLASQVLREVEPLPLVTVTLFFKDAPSLTPGFGCLFPYQERFHSLGVLFNSWIFQHRSSVHSETWILGGALQSHMVQEADSSVIGKILEDRARLGEGGVSPLSYFITRWPKAIPHYTVAWERALERLVVTKPVYLVGNYLGNLGLSQIYELARRRAEEIHHEF